MWTLSVPTTYVNQNTKVPVLEDNINKFGHALLSLDT